MTINYDGKIFAPLSNTENGETSSNTLFYYRQEHNVLTADYSGGQIVKGHLIGLVADDGSIDMRYHQVNVQGQIMTGRCHSTPEIMPNGSIRLHETWSWTSGDLSSGSSVLEERWLDKEAPQQSH